MKKIMPVLCFFAAVAPAAVGDVTVETKAFKLVIGDDALAKSLVIKETGEEMLEPREGIPVFATTQTRPFNNEIRLVQQSKRTTYPANRVRRDGDLLTVGFETAPYEVVVRVTETPEGYAAFKVDRMVSDTEQERQYYHWNMDVPPVDSFRLLQLPVKNRKNFGDWLNVMWDEKGVVGVMGGTPYMDVDNEKRWGWRRMTVESLKDYGVTNGVALLAAAPTSDAFLNQVDAAEAAFKMPRGVRSRRDSRLNASIFWTTEFKPDTMDEILAYMKRGGFRMLLIYHPAVIKAESYATLPDYTWSNGWNDETFAAAVRKFNEAGVTVGFHTLQTFIGLKSKYVTPEADHRLALVKHYTLARALPAGGDVGEILVEENPVAAPMHPKCRILKFGTELFTYAGYTTERPYVFTGVKRGHLSTTAKAHALGEIGGVLGVSECAAISTYIDQNSSLQDEVGAMIARIYTAASASCVSTARRTRIRRARSTSRFRSSVASRAAGRRRCSPKAAPKAISGGTCSPARTPSTSSPPRSSRSGSSNIPITRRSAWRRTSRASTSAGGVSRRRT